MGDARHLSAACVSSSANAAFVNRGSAGFVQPSEQEHLHKRHLDQRNFPPIDNHQERAMAEKTLNDLFHDTLKDIYFAERQIVKTLPKMARAATAPELKAAFETHLQQTEGHVERLQQVFEIIGKRAHGKTCEAIQGIIAEGEEITRSSKAPCPRCRPDLVGPSRRTL
jgi:hypothetical protein